MGRLQLIPVQARFLIVPHVRPADIEAAFGHLEIRRLEPPAVGVDIDRRRAVHRLGDAFDAHPQPAKARQRNGVKAIVHDLLHIGRVQHRDRRVDHGEFALVRQGRRFTGMVVAQQNHHAAVFRRPGVVAVFEHIAATVHARPLAVPDTDHAIDFIVAEQIGLLASPNGGGGQFLVHARLKMNPVTAEKFPRLPELLIDQTEGRAPIPGNKGAGGQARALVPALLQHGQTHQRLDPGHEDLSRFGHILVVERYLAQSHPSLPRRSTRPMRSHGSDPTGPIT